MDDKKILITGSNGFIGRNLTRWLRLTYPQASVCGTVRHQPAGESQIAADLTQPAAVSELLSKTSPNYIFHLAGTLYASGWDEFYASNVKTAVNLLEGVRDAGLAARVILVGSAAEYGNISPTSLPLTEEHRLLPTSLYGVSKACQTAFMHYFASQGLAVFLVRPFNVYGPGMPETLAIGAFVRQIALIKSGQTPSVLVTGNLTPKRDYLYIDDFCSALAGLAAKADNGAIYHICSGHSVAMGDILAEMLKIASVKAELRTDLARSKKIDVADIYGSYAKINAATGWNPEVKLETGLSRVADSL
jgi:GDP-4-dehydro-6-deoxy-D-mannose reductase